jgi:hypothetical protein
MATSDFTNYSSPYPSTLYSATYFSELTFNQAAELGFPTIYRPNTILAWTFTDDIPTAIDSTVQLNEGIPHSTDPSHPTRDGEQIFRRCSLGRC